MASLLVILSGWGLIRELLTPGTQGCSILVSDALKTFRGLNRLRYMPVHESRAV